MDLSFTVALCDSTAKSKPPGGLPIVGSTERLRRIRLIRNAANLKTNLLKLLPCINKVNSIVHSVIQIKTLTVIR